MMSKYTFKENDFKTFDIDGLEPRMDAIKKNIRPQLNALGDYFSDYLSNQYNQPYYPHVAKHLRRTVNPPNDTWVAFATNNRGYKMLPHYQIGLFGSHLFIMYGVIYESEYKETCANKWLDMIDTFRALPDDFVISKDHMKEEKLKISELSDEELIKAIERLKKVKKGEFLIGKKYLPNDEVFKSDDAFLKEVQFVFDTLDPFTIQ